MYGDHKHGNMGTPLVLAAIDAFVGGVMNMNDITGMDILLILGYQR